MGEPAAVWAGCPVNLRLQFPVTDTLSGEELQWTSLVSPRLSLPDTPQVSELAAAQGVCAVTSTVKVLPVGSLGKFRVTEEPGSAETEVPLGPEAAVMTKSAGAVNVRVLSVSFGSLFVTWKG
jgi:hypothetical protein